MDQRLFQHSGQIVIVQLLIAQVLPAQNLIHLGWMLKNIQCRSLAPDLQDFMQKKMFDYHTIETRGAPGSTIVGTSELSSQNEKSSKQVLLLNMCFICICV